MRTGPHWTKALCLCLSISLIFPPAALVAALPGEPAPAEVDAQLEQFATDYENACRLIEELLPQIPRDTFDMKVIVEQARSEPTRLYKWVRDNTYLVPYRGLLRSGPGVLMDRLGNSLDRAMLLYDLLGLAGQEVRLARGTLSDEQLKTLVEGRRKVPPEGALPRSKETSRDNVTALIAELARKHGLDAAQLNKAAEEHTRKAEELRERARQGVASQTDVLLSLLGDLPEKASEAELARPQGEAYRDHWWVQWNKGGRWIDLDPTLPNAKPAQTLSDAEKTLLSEAIEDEIKHRVEIRVIAETWDQGELRETMLFSHRLQPSELMGKRVVLTHHPVRWPRDLTPFSEGASFDRFRATLLEQHEWMPLLRIDNQAAYQSSITVDGIVDETPPLSPAAAMGEGIGSKLGGFGDTLDAIAEPPEPTESEASSTGKVLTAAWIEYLLLVPGQQTTDIRRQIFDLIGPAERVRGRPVLKPEFTDEMGLRRALALLTETDILLLSNELSANYLSRLTAQAVLANEKVFPYILRQVSKGDFQDLATELREVTAFPSSSYGLTLARTAWRRSRAGVYLDRPNILTYHSGARPKAQDQIVQFQGFDIVANFVTVDLDVHRAPFRERIEQGVLDTYAETLLLSGADATIKAGEVIGTFPALKDDWLVVGSPQHLQQQDTQLSKDVRARIENELSAGYLVLLPRPESRGTSIEQVGWWHVDRNTGEALRIGENGWGASTTEWIVTNVTWLLSWGACHFTTALGRPVNLLLCTAGFDLGFVGGALMVTPYTTAAVLLLLAAEALFVTSAFLQ